MKNGIALKQTNNDETCIVQRGIMASRIDWWEWVRDIVLELFCLVPDDTTFFAGVRY